MDNNEATKILEENPEIKEELLAEQGQEAPSRKSQADALVKLAEQAQLFHDENKEPYARIPLGNHWELWPVGSRYFRRWLSRTVWDSMEKTPGSEAIRSALNIIEGKAVFDGDEHKLHNRVAFHDGAIWYDLSDTEWQAVKITPTGWKVESEPPILFKRYSHQAVQVIPVHGGDINDVMRFINVKPEQKLLFIVYLVSCFIPSIPHPIPVFYGEKGAAKTTTTKLVKKLVDPSNVEAVTFPRDINELVQKLSHHWFCGFDNISGLPEWISDCLCRAVTGEGFSKRQLYSDDDDVIYSFKRCISLNGINVVATREDLLDRSVLFELERISTEKRMEELQFWKSFDQARPFILGAILDLVAKALAIYPTVKLDRLHRMADFTKWGYAIAEAIDGNGPEFLSLYGKNVERQNVEAINSNPVAAAIVALINNDGEWEGRPGDLLEELTEIAYKERIDTKDKLWPKASSVLVKRINQVKSNLADTGIIYSNRDTNRGSLITLCKGVKNASTAVTLSQMAISQPLSSDGSSDGSDGNVKMPSPSKHSDTRGYDGSDGSDGNFDTFSREGITCPF